MALLKFVLWVIITMSICFLVVCILPFICSPSIMVRFDCWWSLNGFFVGLWEFFFAIDIYIEFIFGFISWCVCFLHGL
jgi:hypothetical protein